jgi:hypothetical protein
MADSIYVLHDSVVIWKGDYSEEIPEEYLLNESLTI